MKQRGVGHYNKLCLRIIRLLGQYARALLHPNGRISGNDNRNWRLSFQPHANAIRRWIFEHFRIQATSSHRVSQGSEICFARLWFAAACPGGSVLAPMIKHVGNMRDSPRAFRRAQCQIVILRKIELFAKPAEVVHKITTISGEMSQIHARIKKLRAPFRFEKRPRPHSGFV